MTPLRLCRSFVPKVRERVASVVDPSRKRWVSFSHFESDECGALNHWLGLAPAAEPVRSLVGALVSVNDFALRPARATAKDESLETGKCRFRFRQTPHLPHGWDAGLLFEETNLTLLCSDLFHQTGEVEAVAASDIIGQVREALAESQNGPFANYVPYTHHTGAMLVGLAALQPKTLAAMHGSTIVGDEASALRGLADVMREVLSPRAA